MRTELKNSAKFTGLNLFFIAATTLIILNSAYLFSAFQNARTNEKWLQHTNDTLSELELFISSIKDAETGARGYFLTGDSSYLEPYYQGSTETWTHFRILKQLVSDNPAQMENLAGLQNIAQKRLQILSDTIKNFSASSRNKGGVLSSQGTLNEGKVTMDSLRSVIDEMKNEERRLYTIRAAQTRQGETYSYWSIVAAMVINLLLSGAAYYLIRRQNIAQLEKADQQRRALWTQERITELSGLWPVTTIQMY